MAAITLQAPPCDYVLDAQDLDLKFFENSAHVNGRTKLDFFVRVGAKNPVIRLNASQMQINRVTVCGQEIHDYQYFDMLRTIVAPSADSKPDVKDLQQYYCHYRARSEGADQGELEIPVGKQMQEMIAKDSGVGLAEKDKRSKFRKVSITIDYVLENIQAGMRFVEWTRAGFRRKRAYVYTHEAVSGSGVTLCGGAGVRSWLPCIDKPGHTTKMEMLFTVPTGMVVVCTGLCIERRRRGNRRETFLFDIKRTPVHSIGFAAGYLHCVQADDPFTHSFPCYCPIDFKAALEFAINGRAAANSAADRSKSSKRKASEMSSAAAGLAQSTTNTTDADASRLPNENALNAQAIVHFVSHHLEQKYPQQRRMEKRDPAQLLKCAVRERNVDGTLDEDAIELQLPTPQTTPQKGRTGPTPELMTHAQVFVHGLHVSENFHSPALTLTSVKSFAGVVMMPGEYLPVPTGGPSSSDNRLRIAVANGVAAQWFGCWVDVANWTDAWLQAGMIGYLTFLYFRSDYVRPPLPRPTAMDHVWCDLNDAICDEELDPRRKQLVRALCPKENEFWLCEPGVVGSSEFVALKAPYVVHVLDTKDSSQMHFRSQWIKKRGEDGKEILAPVRLERPFEHKELQREHTSGAGSTTPAHSNTFTAGLSSTNTASTIASGVHSVAMHSGMDTSGGGASASGALRSGIAGYSQLGASGQSDTDMSAGNTTLLSAPGIYHDTDQLETPILNTVSLVNRMSRTIKRSIFQRSSVLHVRTLFSCDDKKANFNMQLANPCHLESINHVEVPYLLRARVSVPEDFKTTNWNPVKVDIHKPYPNGLDGVVQRKGEGKPFQYIWLDPDYSSVRRPEIHMDSNSWSNLFYHDDTSFATRVELFQRIGDPPQTARSTVQTTQCHDWLKEILRILGNPKEIARKAQAEEDALNKFSSVPTVVRNRTKGRKSKAQLAAEAAAAAAAAEAAAAAPVLTDAEIVALKLRRRRTTIIARWPHSNIQLLRSVCAWALVRVGNISQSSSMETIPVAKTLRALIGHFKHHFFDVETHRYVDVSRCTDAATFRFKAELVMAIAAIRDKQGRCPIDACLFLRQVAIEDSEWVRMRVQTSNSASVAGGLSKPTSFRAVEATDVAEDPGYTAALIEALANSFIYSKLVWLLLRGRHVKPQQLPQSIFDKPKSGGPQSTALDTIIAQCNRVLETIDDIFSFFNFANTRRRFEQKVRCTSLEDRRVQVACIHALARCKAYGVERFSGPLKVVPHGKLLKLEYSPRKPFDLENIYFCIGAAYPLQLRLTALRAMIRLKMRPKMYVSHPALNFLTWKKNFNWFYDMVLRPLERQLGIGTNRPVGGGVDAAYAQLLLRTAWDELLAVCCFSNTTGDISEFKSAGHRTSGDIGSESRFMKPAIDEGFYFLHQHRKFNGTSVRSEITMPSEQQLERHGASMAPSAQTPKSQDPSRAGGSKAGRHGEARTEEEGKSMNVAYLSSLNGIKFIALRLMRDGVTARQSRKEKVKGHIAAIKSFVLALWVRLDNWYARFPRLRRIVHHFFYNIFEDKQPAAFQRAMMVTFGRNSTLSNVYWREMTHGGASGQQTGMHWPDLEPSEPEPPREDPPRLTDPYVSKHKLLKIPDRRVLRYRMLPLKRTSRTRTASSKASDLTKTIRPKKRVSMKMS